MIISKIHVRSNVVRIGYLENEKEVPREYILKSKELARPELYKAMENIFHVMANVDTCFAAVCDEVIEDIIIKYNRDNSINNYVLAGAMHGDDELVATFKTEKIYAKSWMELDNAVRSAMKEAELFIQGKRAQMTLDIEAEMPAPKLEGGVA
jgi:hypothetical protein